ncbi:hypothetical protein GCM10009785_26600 [Brooklawnia cerclae]|uniref:Uncharacterized protein n=1 Tax=Brooklawnia cerclae TaxID=349934 RepID=A0ABX0SG43_9ACTN|nr:hypothetical protein [Brooklawnia cerclae]NIH57334.1 hypothetical protein [Brooklawnia cerclae]
MSTETRTITIVIDAAYDLNMAGLLPDLHTVSGDEYEAAEAARDKAVADFEAAVEAVREGVSRELGITIEIVYASYGSPEAYAATPGEDDAEITQRAWQAVQDAAAARLDAATGITALLADLNAYGGDNIWQDLILTATGYDDEATAALDPGFRSDVAVIGGHVLRWIEQDHEWAETSH